MDARVQSGHMDRKNINKTKVLSRAKCSYKELGRIRKSM